MNLDFQVEKEVDLLAALARCESVLSKENKPHLRIQASGELIRNLKNISGLTNPEISKKSGISLARIRHYTLASGRHASMKREYPNDAFKLAKTFFKEEEFANRCAAALLDEKRYVDKEEIKKRYLNNEKDYSLNTVFLHTRLFVAKLGIKDIAEKLDLPSYRTIDLFENDKVTRAPYEATFKMANTYLDINTKAEMDKFIKRFKEDMVERGCVKDGRFVSVALSRTKSIQEIIIKIKNSDNEWKGKYLKRNGIEYQPIKGTLNDRIKSGIELGMEVF